MSFEVLTRSIDNMRARDEIRRRGLDYLTPRFKRVLHKTRLFKGINVGLMKKSWDVLRTIEFIEPRVDRHAPILDLGAYSSELLCSLHKMGFRDLTGIDLSPEINRMPYSHQIKYVTGDFLNTSFTEGAFQAITAISVLEHGYCGPKVFREVSRLLKVGGYFVGSIDYWPKKIDTNGIILYGLDWRIFSKDELLSLIEEAGNHGLVPVGQLNFEASEATVRWLKRDYTFAWFAFQKVDAVGHKQSASGG